MGRMVFSRLQRLLGARVSITKIVRVLHDTYTSEFLTSQGSARRDSARDMPIKKKKSARAAHAARKVGVWIATNPTQFRSADVHSGLTADAPISVNVGNKATQICVRWCAVTKLYGDSKHFRERAEECRVIAKKDDSEDAVNLQTLR